MKKVILAAICLGLFIIDNTMMPFLSVWGVMPSLLFCFVLSFSIINGEADAIFVGAVSGILQDIYFPNVFGVNALCNLIICYLAAVIGHSIFTNRKTVPILISGAAAIVKYLFVFIIMHVIGITVLLDRKMIIMAVLNMIVTFFIYYSVYDLCKKEFMKKQWNFAEK